MTELTCHQVYQDAQQRRALYPLITGGYKLKEAQDGLTHRYEGLNLIHSSIDERIPFPPGFGIRGWTVEEWPDELCKLPVMIAKDLGYRVLPAIRVMCADPNAPADLKNSLASIERQIMGCVELCETYRRQIEKPTEQRAATLERISAAECLLASVLMIIEDTFYLAGLPSPIQLRS